VIETTFDETFDLRAAVPPGARVGIVGCANCASVYRTGDTERLEQVRHVLADHCDVVLVTSIDAPCDQRVLRYLTKSLPRFADVEVFVVLACEAGCRSLGAIVAVPVVTPVRTRGFAVRGLDGGSRQACLFCDDCRFPDRSRACPMAACPVRRADGPCQSRTSSRCVVDETMDCSFQSAAGAPVVSASSLSSLSSLPIPTLILPVPATADDLTRLGDSLAVWRGGLVFLAPVPGSLDGLAAAASLRAAAATNPEAPSLGYCPDFATRTLDALTVELRTAAALGLRHCFLREPDWTVGTTVTGVSTIALVERAAADFTVAVQNAFVDDGDRSLLAAQLAAGATVVLSASAEAPAGCRRLAAEPGPGEVVVDLTRVAREAVLPVGDRCYA